MDSLTALRFIPLVLNIMALSGYYGLCPLGEHRNLLTGRFIKTRSLINIGRSAGGIFKPKRLRPSC